jgi:hypothetical protein
VRNTLSALVVIGLVWIGYVAWPLYDLTALVRAIDARDVNTVVHYVNFERVRASLTEQIASAYMRVSGIPTTPLAQQAVVVGLSVADPVIRKLVSPEALSDLLAVGWPVTVVPDPPPPGTLGISADTLELLGRFLPRLTMGLAGLNCRRLRSCRLRIGLG